MQRIYSRIVWDGADLVAVNSRIYSGDVELTKGTSSAQKQIAKQSQDLNSTLINAYKTNFANQQAIFGAIRAVYDPILQAGPSQYGFSKAEDTALRTQASEGTAANYAAARRATAERFAASGGGNDLLPSGVQAQVQGQLTGAAAESESNKQLGITESGFETGRQNFYQATNAEFGVSSGLNPLGYAGNAINSGNSAFGQATKIQELNDSASPFGALGGLAGGILGAVANPLNTAISNKIGGFLGNLGSSNTLPTSGGSQIQIDPAGGIA